MNPSTLKAELLSVWGSDQDIVDAARVSYAGGTRKARSDEALLRYLMRKGHMSPFEMVEVKFRITAPIFVARQWVRHRTASWNEESARYSDVSDSEFFVPGWGEVGTAHPANKQARVVGPRDTDEGVIHTIEDVQRISSEAYGNLLRDGVPREVARMVLPESRVTRWIWKIDIRNLLGVLEQRLSEGAQFETRTLAQSIHNQVAEHFPWTFAAWRDYRHGAMTFTRMEVMLVGLMVRGTPWEEAVSTLKAEFPVLSEAELDEAFVKLRRVGIGVNRGA